MQDKPAKSVMQFLNVLMYPIQPFRSSVQKQSLKSSSVDCPNQDALKKSIKSNNGGLQGWRGIQKRPKRDPKKDLCRRNLSGQRGLRHRN